jgi:hypothetical protein
MVHPARRLRFGIYTAGIVTGRNDDDRQSRRRARAVFRQLSPRARCLARLRINSERTTRPSGSSLAWPSASLSNPVTPEGEPKERHILTESTVTSATLSTDGIGPGRSSYWGTAILKATATRRAKDTLKELIALHADIDFKGTIESPEEVERIVERLAPAPTRCITAGMGCNAFGPLRHTREHPRAQTAAAAPGRPHGSDPAVCEAARLMRLPGTTFAGHPFKRRAAFSSSPAKVATKSRFDSAPARSTATKVLYVPHCPGSRPVPVSGISFLTKSRMVARKCRGGPNGEEFAFTTQLAIMGTDEDGDPIDTLVIEWGGTVEAPTASGEEKSWATKDTRFLRQVMMNLLADCATEIRLRPEGPLVRALDQEVIRAEFYRSKAADGTPQQQRAARQKAFRRAVDSARDRQLIGVRVIEERTWLWLSTPHANA